MPDKQSGDARTGATAPRQPPGPQHYWEWAGRGRAGLVWYMIGAALVLSISLFFGQLFVVVGAMLIPDHSAAATVIKTTFFGFIASFLLLPLVPLLLNRRPAWSIAMARRQFDWRNLLIGAAVAAGVHLAVAAVSFALEPQAFTYSNPDMGSWLPMLAIAAVAFFVQASAEEMVYRGYLTQFARRYVRNPLLVMLIPALVFAGPHYGNVAGLDGPLALLPFVISGLSYGWLAYRSGSLWMSAGAHLGGNWFITCFLGSANEKIEKISLFTTRASTPNGWMLTLSQLVFAVVVCGLAEVILRRTGRIVRLSGRAAEPSDVAPPPTRP